MAVNPHTGELLRGSPFGTWVFPTPYESENLIYDKSISMMPSVLYGDVSGNGGISAYDAALAAQYAVGLISLTAEQITAADVSGNGEVSGYDAALIAQYVVGLIDKFPVEQ